MFFSSEKKYQVLFKRFFTVLLLFFVFAGVADSKTVKKTKKKTTTQTVKQSNNVVSARVEAFKNIKTTLPLLSYKSELTDRNYDVNVNYIFKEIYQSGDGSREFYPYFLGKTLISYGVKYSDKPNYIYYYNSRGNLIRIEIVNNNQDVYPYRTITYNNKGKLHTVVIYISKTEQYNFDGSGNLVVHWIGERGFNMYGKPLKIRRTIN